MLAPNEPIGNSSVASWCRRLLRWCKSIEIQPGVGYRVRKGSGGTTLELLGVAGGANPEPPTKPQYAEITTLHAGDYISVKLHNGSAVYGDEFNVAKDSMGRRPSSETIDSSTINYTYSTENTRTANDSTNSEVQVCYPRYTVGQKVWVSAVDHSGVSVSGSELLFLEMKPSRVWVRRYIQ